MGGSQWQLLVSFALEQYLGNQFSLSTVALKQSTTEIRARVADYWVENNGWKWETLKLVAASDRSTRASIDYHERGHNSLERIFIGQVFGSVCR